LADRALRGSSRYAADRDALGPDATTRLSIPLHLGCVSARAIEERLRRRRSRGAAELRRQLAWRDFWLHVIAHHPENRHLEHDPRFRSMRWRADRRSLEAWRGGRTGYPLVDAAMRQLIAEGWMHNRARMVAASFLAKNLLCDWREGEAHFMRHLLDGDEAQNNGNWQWAASVGADAQPWFRIFNPVLQQRRFDPGGVYVRRWVPELAGLPDRWLAEPWAAPLAVQSEAGCVIGRHYPDPIVELSESRERARARFAAAARR
jgi:deoxyribodipyrimidine photo-lyase